MDGWMYSFFFTAPVVGVSVDVQPAWLVVCLDLDENTYSDGWIMDREKNVTFWFGLLGLLAVIACVIQCLMDGHAIFLFVCFVGMDGGWMGGWMDAV